MVILWRSWMMECLFIDRKNVHRGKNHCWEEIPDTLPSTSEHDLPRQIHKLKGSLGICSPKQTGVNPVNAGVDLFLSYWHGAFLSSPRGANSFWPPALHRRRQSCWPDVVVSPVNVPLTDVQTQDVRIVSGRSPVTLCAWRIYRLLWRFSLSPSLRHLLSAFSCHARAEGLSDEMAMSVGNYRLHPWDY